MSYQDTIFIAFNKTRQIPQNWNHSIVVPLLKSGKKQV